MGIASHQIYSIAWWCLLCNGAMCRLHGEPLVVTTNLADDHLAVLRAERGIDRYALQHVLPGLALVRFRAYQRKPVQLQCR